VLAVLGVADARLLADTVDAVAAGDSARALRSLEECAEQGRDAASFASDLEGRLRELLVVQTLEHVPAELSLTAEADAALAEQAARVPHATVVRTLELVGEAMEAVRAGADPRTRLELALVKAARPEVDGSLRALLLRIERLEGGHSAAAAPAAAPSSGAAPADPDGGRGAGSDEQRRPDTGSPAGPTVALADAPSLAEAPSLSDAPSAAEARAPGDGPAAARAHAAHDDRDEARSAPTSAQPVLAAAGVAGDDPLNSLLAMWPAVVDLVRGENALLGALIAEARPVSASGDEVVLAFAMTAQFLKKKAEDPANRMTVGEAMRAITGTRWRLSYELRETPSEHRGGGGERSEEEWVRRFMAEFDAEEVAGEWPDAAAEPRGDADPAGARVVSGGEKDA
jgi:DNA polymerase-3 subunit gamma/tau